MKHADIYSDSSPLPHYVFILHVLCTLNINIERMKYSCGTGIHNPVSVPQKGFLTTNSFRSVSCYGICVAFLAMSMEAVVDSVLTMVYI